MGGNDLRTFPKLLITFNIQLRINNYYNLIE